MSRNSMAMREPERGFTLIELMVGLGIMAFLLLMAMPGIQGQLMDTKIRVAAQSYHDGAQMARSEALRRTQDVNLSLSDSNRAWDVAVGGTTVASKSAEAASTLTVQASASLVTFNSRGEASANNMVDFMPANADSCLASGGSRRCLRVLISTGGQVRLCDPTVSADGDNRKC